MMRPKLKNIFIALLAIAIAWKLTDLVISTNYINLPVLLAIAAAFPIFGLGFMFSGAWLNILMGSDVHIGTVCATKAIILCSGLNCIIPGRLSELIKPLYFKKNRNASLSVGLSSVMLERVTDLFLLMLAVAFLGGSGFELQWQTFGTVTALLFLGIVTLPYCHKIYGTILTQLLPWKRWRNLALNMLAHFTTCARSSKIWQALFFGALTWLSSFLSVYVFLAMAVDADLAKRAALEFLAATSLAYMIPGLPGGIGIYEAAGAFVLKRWGIPYDQGLLLSAAFHVAQLAFALLGTFILIFFEKVNFTQFKAEIIRYKNKLNTSAAPE